MSDKVDFPWDDEEVQKKIKYMTIALARSRRYELDPLAMRYGVNPVRFNAKIVLANAIAIAVVTGWGYSDYLLERNRSGGRHEDH
jgi:hypothetical protein